VQDFVGTYTTATDASGRRARSITNALGQLVRIDEPTGNNALGDIDAPNQPTFYKYNAQGKMVHVIQGKAGEPAIQHRYFLYDYLGRLIRVRQPEQEVNSTLNTTETIDGNFEWTAKMEYDIVGNLVKTTDAENKQITNTYDKAGRVIKREYSNLDTPTVFYHYDGTGLGAVPAYSKGKLTKVSSTISATQYTSFDNFGRTLTSEQITDGQTYTSKYKYSLSGALLEQTYPSGKVVRNFFESDGDLTKVVRNGKTYVSDFNYNASGGVNSLKLGNGRFETAQYNTRQQLTQLGLGVNSNDTNLFKLQYEYGELTSNGTTQNVGNITKQTITLPNASFVQTYKYDALDRLREAKETNGTSATINWMQTFDYDRFGNRTNFSQQINGQALAINSLTLPSIDATKNRFNVNQGYIYDKTGNIIQDVDQNNNQIRKFVFNGENKQVHVKNASDDPIGTYYYNGEGKRVKKTTATETTIFVYDAIGQMVAEYSTQLSATPTTSYLTSDQLGTPRIITDKNGNVISRRDMMPFGEDLYVGVGARSTNLKYGSTNDEIRQKFTGYQKDKETNLDFAEARYYNNQHGRFTAVDPLLASGQSSNPQSFNRYSYTMNQPLVKTDKTGLKPEWVYDTSAPQGTNRPVWVSHEEFLKGGYTEWEKTTYTTKSGDSIWLDRSGPASLEGFDDSYAGWQKNGVAQGTGIYDGNTAKFNSPFLNDVDNGLGIGIRNWIPNTLNFAAAAAASNGGMYPIAFANRMMNPVFSTEQPANRTQAFAAFAGGATCDLLSGAAVGGAISSLGRGANGSVEIFRGVNSNAGTAYTDALNGVVKPRGGFFGNGNTLTHNTGLNGTVNSRFTSWTTNPDVALNFALRNNGEGVFLRMRVPFSRITPSPNLKSVNLFQQPGTIVSESEVLIRGTVRNVNFSNVRQP
jgi:RHS repeat-associated protein